MGGGGGVAEPSARAAKGGLTFTGSRAGTGRGAPGGASARPAHRCPPAGLRTHRRGPRRGPRRARLCPPEPPAPSRGPAGPSRSALSAGPAPPARGAQVLAAGRAGKGRRTDPRPCGVGAGRVGCGDGTDPAARRAHLPPGVLPAGAPGRRGLFCSRPGGGGGGDGDGTQPGERAPESPPGPRPRTVGGPGSGAHAAGGRRTRAGVRGRGLTSPSSCTGRSSTARPRRPAVRPAAAAAATAAAAGQGPGRGAAATAARRAPGPPAPRPACSRSRSGSGSAADPASAPTEQTLRPARPGGRAGLQVPASHVVRPPRPPRGRPPIPAAAGAARAAAAAAVERRAPRPAAAARASEAGESAVRVPAQLGGGSAGRSAPGPPRAPELRPESALRAPRPACPAGGPGAARPRGQAARGTRRRVRGTPRPEKGGAPARPGRCAAGRDPKCTQTRAGARPADASSAAGL